MGAAGAYGVGFLGGRAGVVGGEFDAEGGVSPGCAGGALPECAHVEDRLGGVVDAAVGGFVSELQGEVLASADLVLVVDVCGVEVEVDVSVWQLG